LAFEQHALSDELYLICVVLMRAGLAFLNPMTIEKIDKHTN
jgi:hypothetical protein